MRNMYEDYVNYILHIKNMGEIFDDFIKTYKIPLYIQYIPYDISDAFYVLKDELLSVYPDINIDDVKKMYDHHSIIICDKLSDFVKDSFLDCNDSFIKCTVYNHLSITITYNLINPYTMKRTINNKTISIKTKSITDEQCDKILCLLLMNYKFKNKTNKMLYMNALVDEKNIISFFKPLLDNIKHIKKKIPMYTELMDEIKINNTNNEFINYIIWLFNTESTYKNIFSSKMDELNYKFNDNSCFNIEYLFSYVYEYILCTKCNLRNLIRAVISLDVKNPLYYFKKDAIKSIISMIRISKAESNDGDYIDMLYYLYQNDKYNNTYIDIIKYSTKHMLVPFKIDEKFLKIKNLKLKKHVITEYIKQYISRNIRSTDEFEKYYFQEFNYNLKGLPV